MVITPKFFKFTFHSKSVAYKKIFVFLTMCQWKNNIL